MARSGWAVAQGVVSWTRRAAHGLTYRHYRDQVTAAKARGDHTAVAEWTDRFDRARTARQARILTWPREIARIALLAAGALAAVAALTVTGGLAAWALPGGRGWTAWWTDVTGLLAWAGVAVKWAATVAVWATGPLLVGLAWSEGRRAAAPAWLLTTDEKAQAHAEVTPSKVVLALSGLGISPLTKAIKDMPDAGAGMLSPIRAAGTGVEVDVHLPTTTSTAAVRAKRAHLAEALDRAPHELHLSTAPTPRTLRAWIADHGALDTPVGPSPLVTDPRLVADWRTGHAPWGLDLRGQVQAVSLYQRHLLLTGLSNQGKTKALRALALWAGLDPSVRLWIADLKGPDDWKMLNGLAERLLIGPTDDHVAAVVEMAEAAVTEMNRRIQAGGRHDPLVVIVDEAQVAYLCPARDEHKRPYGGQSNDARYLAAIRKIHNQGRAVDVTAWEGTQDPTNQNLPVLSRNGNHIRASLVLATEAQAKMALGEAPVTGGAAPHELRRDLDKGVVVAGTDGFEVEPGQVSVTVRTFFIDDTDATTIAQRAIAARQSRRSRPQAPGAGEDTPETVTGDLDAILAALRGEPRVRTTVVLARLIEDDPARYTSWDLARLSAVLTTAGAPPVKASTMQVDRAALEAAIAARDAGPETP